MFLLIILWSQLLLKIFLGQKLRNQALKAPKHQVLADRDTFGIDVTIMHGWSQVACTLSYQGSIKIIAGESLEFVYFHSVSCAMVSVANYRLAWEMKQFSNVMCDNSAIIPSAAGFGTEKKLRRREFVKSISQVTTEEEFVGYKVQQWNCS